MLRIFCSTPGDLEEERMVFHDVVGEVNEAVGMPKGVLLVPVSIVPKMVNKSFFQGVVEENVRACNFFVQILNDTWGPPARNFEREYGLALQLKDDPAAAMEEVAIFFKAANGPRLDSGILQFRSSAQSQRDCPTYEFASLEEYQRQLRVQLSAWLRAVEDEPLS
jgi:hypothetical protein